MAVVTVPVVGKVDQRWLYAGAAGIAGIVGYAWWSGAGQDEGDVLLETPVTDFEPPTVVDSGISTGNITPTPGIAENNVEWLQMAREQAAALGFADALVATALTKYLGRQPLTASEASVIRAVVVILGQPPQNGPFPITESIPTPTPTPTPKPTPKPTPTTKVPAAPRNMGVLPKGGGRVGIAWPAVAGATKYRYRWETANRVSGWTNTTATHRDVTWLFRRGTVFTARVQAGNAAGWGGHVRGNLATAR